MINLLPNNRKKEIKSARTNVLLVRYIIMTLIATAALLASMYSSYLIIGQTEKSADELIATNDTEAGIYSDTKQQVSDLSDRLSGAKTALDQSVVLSDVLTEIGRNMPEGTILSELTLSAQTISSPISLTAYGKDTDSLLNLQSNFGNSTLFAQSNFETIEAAGGQGEYPASMKLTITINPAWSK